LGRQQRGRSRAVEWRRRDRDHGLRTRAHLYFAHAIERCSRPWSCRAARRLHRIGRGPDQVFFCIGRRAIAPASSLMRGPGDSHRREELVSRLLSERPAVAPVNMSSGSSLLPRPSPALTHWPHASLWSCGDRPREQQIRSHPAPSHATTRTPWWLAAAKS
jgi:hypothetical protein